MKNDWKTIKQVGVIIFILLILILINMYGTSFSTFHQNKYIYMEENLQLMGKPNSTINSIPHRKLSTQGFPFPGELMRMSRYHSYFVKNTSRVNILSYYENEMRKLGWKKLKFYPNDYKYLWCGDYAKGGEYVLATLSMPENDKRNTKESFTVYLSMKWIAPPRFDQSNNCSRP